MPLFCEDPGKIESFLNPTRKQKQQEDIRSVGYFP